MIDKHLEGIHTESLSVALTVSHGDFSPFALIMQVVVVAYRSPSRNGSGTIAHPRDLHKKLQNFFWLSRLFNHSSYFRFLSFGEFGKVSLRLPDR
jgi:hypothetical protein